MCINHLHIGRGTTFKENQSIDEEIDPNVCCMCFGSYDDLMEGAGTEWISCACGRWLHEDCGEDCILDDSGQERFCPYCVDILSA